jgi:hypothetical protein
VSQNVGDPSRPVILGPSGSNPAPATGASPPPTEASTSPPLSPELAAALDEPSVSEGIREICRDARPDRPAPTRLQELATLRAEPAPTAPVVATAPRGAVVMVLECVVGEPSADTRVWLKLASARTGAANPAYLLAAAGVATRVDPSEAPAGAGPAGSTGAGGSFGSEAKPTEPKPSEPKPTEPSVPVQPQGRPSDGRTAPGQIGTP